jgi:hypothetical protein
MSLSSAPACGDFSEVSLLSVGLFADYLQAKDAQGHGWLLRVLKSGLGERATHRRFRKGFALQQSAHGKGVAQARLLTTYQGTPCALMPGEDGLPLQLQLGTQPWPLVQALRLGADIAEGLERVHSLGLVHGNVSAATILWNRDMQSASLHNFDLARTRNDATGPDFFNRHVQTDPACMPPECSGRMVQALRLTPGFAQDQQVLAHWTLSEPEIQTARQVLREIKTCLQDNNANALEVWETHVRILRPMLKRWAQTEVAIGAFEFESAMELLNQEDGA